MATTGQYKPFSEVATDGVKAKRWYSSVPPGVHCTVKTYLFGEKIDMPAPGCLAVVLSGAAEICEESRLDKDYLAYRPIRVLGPGDIFNDFTIADTVLDITLPEGGETWNMFAGAYSILVLNKVSKGFEFCGEDLESIAPHTFMNRHSKKNTKIAVLNFDRSLFVDKIGQNDLLSRRTEFFSEILSEAWRKGVAYRVGLNSYNLASLIHFRRLLETSWTRVREAEGVSTQHAATNKLRSLFADAMFEALGRPLQGSPVFAHLPNTLEEECWAALEKHVARTDVLTACEPASARGTFYYPIDLHNFEINRGAKKHAADARKALGYHRKKRDDDRDTHLQEFYLNVANQVIDLYCKEKYPYSVRCVARNCLIGRMILLEFEKKPPVQ